MQKSSDCVRNKSWLFWGFRAFWVSTGVLLISISLWQRAIAGSPVPSAQQLTRSIFAGGVIYLCSIWMALRRSETLAFAWILAVGIICRIIMIPTAPLFDTDINRYLWDGKVASYGYNPYSFPPDADELINLRDQNWNSISSDNAPATSGPCAELIYRLAYTAGIRSVSGLKWIFFFFDTANILLIAALLSKLRLPACWALIYAWSPLAIKEFANSGHVEPVMLFFLILAFYCRIKYGQNRAWMWISYGAAGTVKLIPLLLAPVVWRMGRWKAVCWGIGTAVIICLPFWSAGGRLLASAGIYTENWGFNEGIFALLRATQSAILPDGWSLPIQPAMLIAALLVGTYSVHKAVKLRPFDRIGAMTASLDILALCLFVMPAMDPAYACWLLPFLCVSPSIGLLLFTVTCTLPYIHFTGTISPVWISVIEFCPVFLILLGEYASRRRALFRFLPIRIGRYGK